MLSSCKNKKYDPNLIINIITSLNDNKFIHKTIIKLIKIFSFTLSSIDFGTSYILNLHSLFTSSSNLSKELYIPNTISELYYRYLSIDNIYDIFISIIRITNSSIINIIQYEKNIINNINPKSSLIIDLLKIEFTGDFDKFEEQCDIIFNKEIDKYLATDIIYLYCTLFSFLIDSVNIIIPLIKLSIPIFTNKKDVKEIFDSATTINMEPLTNIDIIYELSLVLTENNINIPNQNNINLTNYIRNLLTIIEKNINTKKWSKNNNTHDIIVLKDKNKSKFISITLNDNGEYTANRIYKYIDTSNLKNYIKDDVLKQKIIQFNNLKHPQMNKLNSIFSESKIKRLIQFNTDKINLINNPNLNQFINNYNIFNNNAIILKYIDVQKYIKIMLHVFVTKTEPTIPPNLYIPPYIRIIINNFLHNDIINSYNDIQNTNSIHPNITNKLNKRIFLVLGKYKTRLTNPNIQIMQVHVMSIIHLINFYIDIYENYNTYKKEDNVEEINKSVDIINDFFQKKQYYANKNISITSGIILFKTLWFIFKFIYIGFDDVMNIKKIFYNSKSCNIFIDELIGFFGGFLLGSKYLSKRKIIEHEISMTKITKSFISKNIEDSIDPILDDMIDKIMTTPAFKKDIKKEDEPYTVLADFDNFISESELMKLNEIKKNKSNKIFDGGNNNEILKDTITLKIKLSERDLIKDAIKYAKNKKKKINISQLQLFNINNTMRGLYLGTMLHKQIPLYIKDSLKEKIHGSLCTLTQKTNNISFLFTRFNNFFMIALYLCSRLSNTTIDYYTEHKKNIKGNTFKYLCEYVSPSNRLKSNQ